MSRLDTAWSGPAVHRIAGEANRRAEAMAALNSVMDPELDAAVTEMGFVESLSVELDRVSVDFRLPTFWCSANFAFLMAGDMKLAIEALDWVRSATIRLVDHFAAGRINRAIADGRSFGAAFGCETDQGLASLRRTFLEKAFLGRQERLLRHLSRRHGVEATLSATIADVRALTLADDMETRGLALRYLSARLGEAGGTSDDALAFVTPTGEPIRPAAYADHLRAIRRVRSAAEANAEMCRIYLDARYAGVEPGMGTALDRGNRDE